MEQKEKVTKVKKEKVAVEAKAEDIVKKTKKPVKKAKKTMKERLAKARKVVKEEAPAAGGLAAIGYVGYKAAKKVVSWFKQD